MVSTLKSQDYIVTDLQGSIMFRGEEVFTSWVVDHFLWLDSIWTLSYHLPTLTWAIISVPFTLLLITEEDKINELTKQDLQVQWIELVMNQSQLLEEERMRRASWMMDLGVRGENKGDWLEWYKQTQARFLSSHFYDPSRMDLLLVASSPSNPMFFDTTPVFVSSKLIWF